MALAKGGVVGGHQQAQHMVGPAHQRGSRSLAGLEGLARVAFVLVAEPVRQHHHHRGGHGFGIGPGAGHLIADIVTGADPLVDPRPYHPNRFSQSAWGKVADF